MFKKLSVVLVSVFVLFSGCNLNEEQKKQVPTHTEIHAGQRYNVIALECGQPCALVRSEDDTAFVAILADGSTITFTFDE